MDYVSKSSKKAFLFDVNQYIVCEHNTFVLEHNNKRCVIYSLFDKLLLSLQQDYDGSHCLGILG